MKYIVIAIRTSTRNRDEYLKELGNELSLGWNIVRADCTHDTIIYILSKDGE